MGAHSHLEWSGRGSDGERPVVHSERRPGRPGRHDGQVGRVELLRLLRVFRRRWPIIVLVGLLGAGIGVASAKVGSKATVRGTYYQATETLTSDRNALSSETASSQFSSDVRGTRLVRRRGGANLVRMRSVMAHSLLLCDNNV